MALQNAVTNAGLSDLLSGPTVMVTPLLAALGYMLKALADTCKSGNKSSCTKEECKRAQTQQGRFKISILAAIIMVILLTIGWCVTFSVTEGERKKIENEVRSRELEELKHRVRAEMGINNSIAVLDRVKSGLDAEFNSLETQLKERSNESRQFLRGSLLNIIAVLSQQADYCRTAEEMVAREEPENIAEFLFKMQRELVLTLYPEYHIEEAAKAGLRAGDKLPELPLINSDEVWKRRQDAVNKIKNIYFPEIILLRQGLEAKLASFQS